MSHTLEHITVMAPRQLRQDQTNRKSFLTWIQSKAKAGWRPPASACFVLASAMSHLNITCELGRAADDGCVAVPAKSARFNISSAPRCCWINSLEEKMHHYREPSSLHITKTSMLLSCKHHYPTFPPTTPDLLTINCITMLENPFFSTWSMNERFKIIRMEMFAYTKLRVVRLLTALSFTVLSNILATAQHLYLMCKNSYYYYGYPPFV